MIGSLAREIVHMIFAYLSPQHVTEARLAHRIFAEIGLHYLLNTFYLVFTKQSFQNLLEISQHPIVSQYVKAICYEADNLQQHTSFKKWEKHIYKPYAAEPSLPLTRAKKRSAYKAYQEILAEQKEMQTQDYGRRTVQTAMSRLPNLKNLWISINRSVNNRTSTHLRRAYSRTLQLPLGDPHRAASQLDSLLLGSLAHKLEIEELICGYIHWAFLRQPYEIHAKYKQVMQHIKTLELHISADSPRYYPRGAFGSYTADIDRCRQYIKEGRLCELTAAAPNLNKLAVRFGSPKPHTGACLEDITGDFTWPSLRCVEFSCIEMTEDTATTLFERHSRTLKEVSLASVTLSAGSWVKLWRKMAQTLLSDQVTISGDLWDSEGPYYDFGTPRDGLSSDMRRAWVEFSLLTGRFGRSHFTLPDDLENLNTSSEPPFSWSL